MWKNAKTANVIVALRHIKW